MRSYREGPGASNGEQKPEPAPSATGVWGWLRLRLLPRGENVLIAAAYAIILAALISVIFNRHQLSDWQLYAVLVCLAFMFVSHMLLVDLEARLGAEPAALLHLALNGGLFLLINYVGLSEGFSFLPFLLFMLASEAFVTTRLAFAVAYTVLIAIGWLGIVGLRSSDLAAIWATVPGIGLGLMFTIMLSLVLVRYRQQTARAEELAVQLKAANRALQQAREREKNLAAATEQLRLARDIHDGLGHHLTALNIQLQAATRLLERDPERAMTTIEVCREQARAALDEVRRSVASMRESPIDARVLSQVVHGLVQEFNRTPPPEARLELLGDEILLPPPIASTLYRTAQEGLTNTRKYAAAMHVLVRIRFGSDFVRLCVEDDGIGAPRQTQAAGGFGLAGLRERAEQLGGNFSAGSRAESGFRIEIEIPLTQPVEDPASTSMSLAKEQPG